MFQIFLTVFIGFVLCFPNSVFAHTQTQIIEMTPDGFDPVEVTVDTNATLIFRNKDTQARWPASNTHPTHDLYPEFDPKQPIQPGKSWTFKPKKARSFKYHDHLFPHKRGIIIVTKESGEEKQETKEEPKTQSETKNNLLQNAKQFILNIVISIKNLFQKKSPTPSTQKNVFNESEFKKADYKKQDEIITALAKQSSAESSWEKIKLVFKGKAGSTGSIHDLAHRAGNLLFEEKGLKGIKNCSSEFAFGCYHGFLDKAFAKDLNQLEEAHEACLRLGKGMSGPVASCIHGIGHGVASYHLTSDLKKSLSTCRKLSTGSEYCFDGVFMEFVRSASNSFFKEDNPFYPCDELEEGFGYAYSFSCGRNQPALLMGRFQMSFEEVTSLCVNASSKPFKEGCIEALSLSLASNQDTEKIIHGCQTIGEEFANLCIEKAAGELVFQDSPDWKEKTQALCNASAEGKKCLDYVNNLVVQYGRTAS